MCPQEASSLAVGCVHARDRETKGDAKMSPQTQTKIENRILAALPTQEYDRLLEYLTPVSLPLGDTLYKPEERIDSVYFLNTGVVSLVANMKDGKSVEVGLVGNEGMVGLSIVLGDDISPNHAIVQIADGAMRMSAVNLKNELKREGR